MPFGSLSNSQRITVLLEILGGPKFAAGMKAAAAQTTALGRSTNMMGNSMATSSKKTWLQNQALYTFRRYAFYGTIAATALGVTLVKLGYQYQSAMQQARVALRPVVKDSRTLNNYLTELFQISKYSPFVLSDLTKAFSVMYLSMHPIGISGKTILTTLRSVVDYLSIVQQTTPMAMRRVTNALGDLAYQGNLTGRMYQRLAQIGIPVGDILRTQLGLQGVTSSNVSQQNISASVFLGALNSYAKNTPGIKNAARRIALRTLPGMIQVARDTISQISGHLISGAYGGPGSGLQGAMTKLLGFGGPLDQISKKQTGKGTLFEINRQITGGTGLAQGFMLLLRTTQLLAQTVTRVLVPAFVIGLHSLIIFYPILKAINFALGLLVKHASIAKWVFAGLAAEFVITHFAMLGMWTASKFFAIATFGTIRSIKQLIVWMKVLRTVEFAGLTRRLWAYLFALRAGGASMGKWNRGMYANTGIVARYGRAVWLAVIATRAWIVANRTLMLTWLGAAGFIGLLVLLYFKVKLVHDTFNSLWRNLIYWSPLVGAALTVAFGPIGAVATSILLVIRYWSKLKQISRDAAGMRSNGGTDWGRLLSPFNITPLFGHHAAGTGTSFIGESGMELATFPKGTRITPNRSVTQQMNGSSFMDKLVEGIVIHNVTKLDRKVVAESYARAAADKKATMD